MSNVYTNDGIIIAKVMRDHLNSWEDKPVEFKIEVLDTNTPSLMLQQLASAERKRTYVDGSYIGTWHFAIYMRVKSDETASRLQAISVLEEINNWLSATDANGNYKNLPVIDDKRTATKIEMLNTPSLAARYNEGYEDYQAVFSFEYKVRRQ